MNSPLLCEWLPLYPCSSIVDNEVEKKNYCFKVAFAAVGEACAPAVVIKIIFQISAEL